MAVPTIYAKLPQEVLGALQPMPQMEATPGTTRDKAFLSITLPLGPTGHTYMVHNTLNQLVFPPRLLSEGDERFFQQPKGRRVSGKGLGGRLHPKVK